MIVKGFLIPGYDGAIAEGTVVTNPEAEFQRCVLLHVYGERGATVYQSLFASLAKKKGIAFVDKSEFVPFLEQYIRHLHTIVTRE